MDERTRQQESKTAFPKNAEQERLVAADASTAPQLLRQLAISTDRQTREAVAANPNTPPDALFWLGAEFPEQLLENPVFPLLLLENLNLIEEIPPPALRSILKQENVPLYFLERAADKADLEVQLALAMNVQTPKKILSRLAQSRHVLVADSARLHVSLAGELTGAPASVASEAVEKTLRSAGSAGTSSLVVLAQICPIPALAVGHWLKESDCRDLCVSIAQSPGAKPTLLEQLANHPDANIRLEVARNPNTPADALRRLATDGGEVLYGGSVRAGVAENPRTPAELLEALAQYPDRAIRRKLVENSNTPLTVLEQLAGDSEREISRSAGKALQEKRGEYDVEELRNRNTPPQVLEQQAKQHAVYVAKHPNTPLYLLFEFSQSENPSLRRAAATNPSAPVSMLEQLAGDKSSQIRREVARHPSTPAHLLEQLARDEDFKVRAETADHPRTPVRILFKQLAREVRVSYPIIYKMSPKNYECPEAESLRDLLAEESTSPLEILLQRLARDGGTHAGIFLAKRWDLPADLLEELSRSADFKVRQAVAENPSTPASCLQQLAGDKQPEVRQGVAENPNTPLGTLEQLAKDENFYVRMRVAERTSLPAQLLEELAGDKMGEVRAKAMVNPSLSTESAGRILCGEYAAEYLKRHPSFVSSNPDILAAVINRCAKSESLMVSFIALCQPQISQDLLREKSRSVLWLERFAVAQNQQTPLETLKRLREDGNRLVRAAARDLLQKLL